MGDCFAIDPVYLNYMNIAGYVFWLVRLNGKCGQGCSSFIIVTSSRLCCSPPQGNSDMSLKWMLWAKLPEQQVLSAGSNLSACISNYSICVHSQVQ